MKKLRILSVFGTRPEAIKMIPLVQTLARQPDMESLCAVTAQHREMLDSVLDIFSLKPDYDLNIMEPRQSLYTITAKALTGMEGVLEQAKPDLVLVHGDTSTTFAGALAAFYAKVPVGHVEAGLRTYDKYSPFPEEMNRTLVTRIAALHFCPTEANVENLRREGVAEGVYQTGNTVIDALRTTVRPGYVFAEPALNGLDFQNKRVILVTCHRRENYGQPMEDVMTALAQLAGEFPDVELVYPVHLSPVVQEVAHRHLDSVPNAHLIPPLDVADMHNLMARCHLVLTDSGGLQEEAPSLGKPVLVLRRETERPEAVTAGTVKLAGTKREDVVALTRQLLTDPSAYAAMAHATNPYGDGHACDRIAQAIRDYFQ